MNDPVSVAIPTIGRINQLRSCLESLAQSTIKPDEILLLDQSGGNDVVELAVEFDDLQLRVERCKGVGIARNMNLALQKCSTEFMLVTHDDCTVHTDWVERGVLALASRPGCVVSGQVFPGDNNGLPVPSVRVWDEPYDFTGSLAHGAIYPNNMGLHRTDAIAIGGFDERPGFARAAEDLDFSYRWLADGRPLLYEPTMKVTHEARHTAAQLIKVHKHYARAAGRFYGKHLAALDRRMIPYITHDIGVGVRSWIQLMRGKGKRYEDERLELPYLVPVGILEGIYEAARIGRQAGD